MKEVPLPEGFDPDAYVMTIHEATRVVIEMDCGEFLTMLQLADRGARELRDESDDIDVTTHYQIRLQRYDSMRQHVQTQIDEMQ